MKMNFACMDMEFNEEKKNYQTRMIFLCFSPCGSRNIHIGYCVHCASKSNRSGVGKIGRA